jgi:putative alpha-1,2-mannosidase
MSLCKGWTQGGSNADVVLVDAYVKNLTGIDYNLAYEAIRNDAENEPLDWSNEGRGGLQSWKRLNYIPYLDYDYLGFGTNSRSISRTVEYAYDDFCLSQLAKGLGKDSSVYFARSGNWKNLFKADQTSSINGTDTGFVGFFQPKYLNGTWGYQDPIACSPLTDFCSLTSNPSETFESSVWEYQFYVPQDVATLISMLKGPDEFIKRLDYAFESGLLDISNEPVFLTVFLYHYAGRPGLSTKRAHYFIPSKFNNSTSGLPGNDDSGAMGAFAAFAMMGLWPVAGQVSGSAKSPASQKTSFETFLTLQMWQNVYLISTPFFESVSIRSPITNKTATIRNVNFDPSYQRIYIQNVTLNGKSYSKSWIGHEFFTEGWTLNITLGDTESTWGTNGDDLPPSYPTEGVEAYQTL